MNGTFEVLSQMNYQPTHLANTQGYGFNSSSPFHGVNTPSIEERPNTDGHLRLVPGVDPRHTHYQAYPLPLATHAAVIEDKQLFMHSLDNFLAALGTSLIIPKIKGKDLDLHQFYKEVTTHGGLQQIVQCKGWKEIVEALDVLKNYPGASFVLRNHYLKLLYHFEQVYYFGIQGQLLPPPSSLPAPSQVKLKVNDESPYEIPTELESALKRKKKKMNPTQIFGVDPAATLGNVVTGAINRKFEKSYLVTVVVGEERLTGVLYHVPSESSVQQFASVPGLLDGSGHEFISPGVEVQLQGKTKESHKKDPNAPRRMRTGYNIFFKEQRSRLRQLYPEKGKEISRIVIEMWSKLPEDEKSLYIQRSQHDRERYQQEMLEYEEKLKLHSRIAEGSGCAGQPTEQEVAVYDGSHDYHVILDSEAEINAYPVSDVELLESQALHGALHFEQGCHTQEYAVPYIAPAYQMNECGDQNGPPSGLRYPPNKGSAPSSVPDHGYESYGIYQDHQLQEQEVNIGYQHRTHINVFGTLDGITTQQQPSHEPENEFTADPAVAPHVSSETANSVQSNQIRHAQCVLEAPTASLLTEQHFSSQGVFIGNSPQQITVASKSLGIPASPTQVCNGQANVLSYLRHDQGNQVMGKQVLEADLQSGQIPLGDMNQHRYPYPVPFYQPQAYSSEMHFYPDHFPRTHTLPYGVTETQALQYKHAFIPYLHQPSVKPPDVSGFSISGQKNYASKEDLSHPQKDS